MVPHRHLFIGFLLCGILLGAAGRHGEDRGDDKKTDANTGATPRDEGLPRLAPGTLVVTFRTHSYQGTYAPKNVLAVWVVDANGQYVRDLAIYADNHVDRLGRWRKDSGKDKPDATTGATRKQHGKVSVVWDGTDAQGKPVPDGTYRIRIEYTETSRLGPAFQITVRKGKDTGTHKLKGNDYFSLVSVHWVGEQGEAAKK